MQTCTWAPTTFQGTQVVNKRDPAAKSPAPEALLQLTTDWVRRYEELGLSHLLIAQRWWGNGEEIEASSLDCLAMTALFAGITKRLHLITAIHPGFFSPTAIAKWGATLSCLSGGRWAINVTSGWNMQEFDMYGVDKLTHDERYERSKEFIEVLRGAWNTDPYTHQGRFYQTQALSLEPKPAHPLQVYQGGQSDAAIHMAASHSDWMFMNGGPLERIAEVISKVRSACVTTGREVKFAMYAAPLCRSTDGEAWDEIDRRLARVDQALVARRRERVSGATGMWSDEDDPLSVLDTNEGYAARLIGSPDTIFERIRQFQALGIEMLHLDVSDPLFNSEVLPQLADLN